MEFKHKGYTLHQSEENNHYMVFDSNGKFVLHAQCTKPLSELDAVRAIEDLITLSKEVLKHGKSGR